MVVQIVLMGNHSWKLVANVSHNEWWKCGYVTWLHVCTLYNNCNIVVTLVAHLQQFKNNCQMQFLKKLNMVDYICMYDVYKLLYKRPIFNSLQL